MIIIVFFAIAVMLGATLAMRHFQGKTLPIPLALSHGAFAATGLVALIVLGPSAGFSPLWKPALGVFIVVALGGFALFTFQLRKAKLPTPLVIGHAAGALVAFGLLLAAAFAAG